MVATACGVSAPLRASTAAACAIDVGLEVLWPCSLVTAEAMAGSAAK